MRKKSKSTRLKSKWMQFIVLLLCVSVLVAGCGVQDKNEDENGTTDISVDSQSKVEYLSLPEDIVELEDREIRKKYIHKIVEYDATQLEYQILKRIDSLGYTVEDFGHPGEDCAALYQDILAGREDITGKKVVEFHGSTGEELQTTINENAGKVILLNTSQIIVSTPIRLVQDTCLMGNGCSLVSEGEGNVLEGEEVSHIIVNNLKISGSASNALFFKNCNYLEISQCMVTGMKERALVICGNSKNCIIADNTFTNNYAGGIYAFDNVNRMLFYHNRTNENYGCVNDNAGFALGNCMSKDLFPSEIILYQNQSSNNQSGGYYCSGLYKSYFIGNEAIGNQKEGSCLDWQTFGCYLLENTYKNNGWRANQPDDVLQRDAVLEDGRMDDGSSNAKLPGLSLDNAGYNIIEQNTVSNNAGSGIKMVRVGICNYICDNTIIDNNTGQNSIYHFFAIELGGEKDIECGKNMDVGEESQGEWNMDAGPDIGNVIVANDISGAHYAAIYLAEGAQDNVVRDNKSTGETDWLVESISERANVFFRNKGDCKNRIL